MTIDRVIVRNYRILRSVDIALNSDLNIIVGDNESGKSTLLEAIHLALRCQLDGRPLSYGLHPFMFNAETTADFLNSIRDGTYIEPPIILIELYLADKDTYAKLIGDNNTLKSKVPGISLRISLDDALQSEYAEYIANPESIFTIPIDFYKYDWLDFSGERMNPRKLPIRSAMIDPTAQSSSHAANKYLLESVESHLSNSERVALSLSYRGMRDEFVNNESVKQINEKLAEQKGVISDKPLSVALDTTSKSTWEASVVPHLADIPLSLVGKGEQNCVKIKLAIGSEDSCEVLLIEEPENHLTHSNLNKLIRHMAEGSPGHQLIVTTHSSFVLNKLGVDHVQMFTPDASITLNHLSNSTRDYFRKLAGYDTLRMILSKRSILVEGPSDELVVQRAYKQQYDRLPIEDEVEVISIASLAFGRFLEIAKLLNIPTSVVTDNDGDPDGLAEKYSEFEETEGINIFYDDDASCRTLERQLVKANGRALLNVILGKDYADEESLLKYMENNKTDVALRIFDSDTQIVVPEYIQRAIDQ